MNFIKCRPILPCHPDHFILQLIIHTKGINRFPQNASRDNS
ncbi:hypothetical protein N9037_04195 [Akkermansiaceae bacterium]|nr:hypothetical protein [Akkermansiaceae bacterium]